MSELKDEKVELKKHFDEKAKEVKEGKKVTVSLTKTYLVEFTKDFGLMKKGHTQKVSQLAKDVYEKKKVIKVIND